MFNQKFNTLHYLIALLKQYKIQHIVASPGFVNSSFNMFVQSLDNFTCHSVVDERSAGYVALGISRETDNPVVMTCTGATASRNYLSALTEAYYSNVPLVAITFFPYQNNQYNLAPQFVDRSISQNDIKALSVELPLIKSAEDVTRCLLLLNVALLTAKYKKLPVHINCPMVINYEMDYTLPDNIWHTDYYKDNFEILRNNLKNKKVGIFIGEHSPFSPKEQDAISKFALSWNAPVFCDHTSQYKGENKILISQYSNIKQDEPDIIIDIGRICGDYNYPCIYNKAEIWRISEDGNIKVRRSLPLKKFFECSEEFFFETMCNTDIEKCTYYDNLKTSIDKLKVPDLPLCNPLICSEISKLLPKNSTLHLSILNSLRSMNFFNVDDSIKVTSNVGGFGIDGAVSTLIGQSFASPDKTHFGIIGDLAFFYDMNALGLREIKNNVRIIVVNNNRGEEFRLIKAMEKNYSKLTDEFIAAAGHYKNGAENWAKSCNFKYLCARNKQEFLAQTEYFCKGESDKPILFEVFTTNEDEQKGMQLINIENETIIHKILERIL